MKEKLSNNTWALLPVWGICLFVLLYIVATFFYPGGSDVDKATAGFSWQHNYWCELMASQAQNGKVNTARPVSITAMFVLAISLTVFWYQIPRLLNGVKSSKQIIQCSGIASMLIMPFMFTGSHDMVMNIAALLGCIALIGLLTKLFTHKMYWLFGYGIFCLVLCGINNYVYYTSNFLYWLPVIQKISFIAFLSWFVLVTIRLLKSKSRI